MISFGVKYADDKNSDVRTWSIALLSSVAGEIGYGKLQPYLKNLRPPIIKSIEDKLEDAGGNDHQDFDEKPIKVKTSAKTSGRGKYEQPEL